MARNKHRQSQGKISQKGRSTAPPDLSRYFLGQGVEKSSVHMAREKQQILDHWKAATRRAIKGVPRYVAGRILRTRLRRVWLRFQLALSIARRVHVRKQQRVLTQLRSVIATRQATAEAANAVIAARAAQEEDEARTRSNTGRRSSEAPLAKGEDGTFEKEEDRARMTDDEGRAGGVNKPSAAEPLQRAGRTFVSNIVDFFLDACGRIVQCVQAVLAGARSVVRYTVVSALAFVGRAM